MYQHPLFSAFEPQKEGSELRDIGIKMVMARLGPSMVSDLIRMIEALRQRQQQGIGGGEAAIAAATAGWGQSASSIQAKDPKFLEYLTTLQQAFMKEFASGPSSSKR